MTCCALHATGGRFRCEAPEPIRKADDDQRNEIERLADELAPEIATAVRQALEEHADRIPLDELETAIRAGDNAAVMAIVGGLDEIRAGSIVQALEDAVWRGGALAAREPTLSGASFTFNRLNPDLVRWLADYGANLVREIDAGTQASVRSALISGMQTGQGPIQQARAVREAISLTAGQARAVQSYRKELETIHLRRSASGWGLGNEIDRRNGRQVFQPGPDGKPQDGIDERRLRDFRYDGVTQRAIDTRTALKPEQIDRMVAAYQRKYLRHRSETIARTESLRAAVTGALDAWRQAVASGKVDGALVRKRWMVSKDERACNICNQVPKMNPKQGVPLNAPFKTPKGMLQAPLLHPNCRCFLLIRAYEPRQLT